MKQRIRFSVQAVTMFQTALEISPEHPASMYGLASALFGQASECRSIGAIRWSASLLQVYF
jgi:cytochrome c-type biogenesis protein CcmH/NrfG